MKKNLLFTFALASMVFTGFGSFAQMTQKSAFPSMALSPMEMAYYPVGYPGVRLKKDPGTLVARVIYCRPQMKGRVIFGKLVPYGQVWRLGANESTEIDFFVPVTIAGQQIQPGRYTLYTIPETGKWTMILSHEIDTWGAFSYKQSDDILRTVIPVKTLSTPLEDFSIVFQKASGGANLVMAWDKTEASLPIHFTAGM
ncbi:MAG TPA: DUF2911 domain-containing protein [Chitinophagaceae bacterium]|nr:DUF2911 domain-containing protein [Chitinophagaceae bacterium]